MKLTLKDRRALAMKGRYHELFERADVAPLDFGDDPINGAITPSGDYNPDDENLDDILTDLGVYEGDEQD